MPRRNTGAKIRWLDKRGCFYIVWYEGGRERLRSTGETDGRAANDALAAFIREQRRLERRGDALPPERMTVAEALDLYGTGHAPTAADPARIGYAIQALLPYWGDKSCAAVGRDTCRAYAQSRKRAPATVRRELGTLQAALNYAVSETRMTLAPMVTLPPKPDGKDRWLTREEAAQLLNSARTGRSDVRLYLPLFVLLGIYTGARKEAILSLRWPQVDLHRGRINFKRGSDDAGDGQAVRLTNKRRSHIPIPKRLMTFLRLARIRGTDLGYVIHDKGLRVLDIGGGWDGDPERPGNGSFGTACKRAGLADVTPHTLRHTCGTWLAQAGVPLFKIGQWLEHSDARTTKLYSHHSPDFQDEAMAALDRSGHVTRTVARTGKIALIKNGG